MMRSVVLALLVMAAPAWSDVPQYDFRVVLVLPSGQYEKVTVMAPSVQDARALASAQYQGAHIQQIEPLGRHH